MEDILLFFIFLFITFIIFIIIYFIYNYNNLYLIDKFTNNNCNNYIKHENSYCYPGVKGKLIEKNQLKLQCKSKDKCKGYIVYNKGDNINKGYLCRDNWSGTLNNYDKTDTYECQTNCECPEGYTQIKCDPKTGIAICKPPIDNKIQELKNIINTNKTNLENIINTNKTNLENNMSTNISDLEKKINKIKKIYLYKSIRYIYKDNKNQIINDYPNRNGYIDNHYLIYIDGVEINGKIYKLEDLEYIDNSFFNKFKDNIVSHRKNYNKFGNSFYFKPYYILYKRYNDHTFNYFHYNHINFLNENDLYHSQRYGRGKYEHLMLKYLLAMSLLETEKITVNLDDLNNLYETDEIKVKKLKITYLSNTIPFKSLSITLLITFYSNKNNYNEQWYFVIEGFSAEYYDASKNKWVQTTINMRKVTNTNVKENDPWYISKLDNLEYIEEAILKAKDHQIYTGIGYTILKGHHYNPVGIKFEEKNYNNYYEIDTENLNTKDTIHQNKKFMNGTEIYMRWDVHDTITFKFCNNKFIVSAIDETFYDSFTSNHSKLYFKSDKPNISKLEVEEL